MVTKEQKHPWEFTTRSQLYMVFRQLKRHNPAMIGIGIILMVLLIALLAPIIAPHHFAELNVDRRLEGPSWEYPFGTDNLGRCVFSRIIYGFRIALLVGLALVSIEAGIGIPLGLYAGFYGGKLDKVISGLTDSVMAFPGLVLALGIVTMIGPGLVNVITALAIVSWPGFTRITRAKVQAIKEREFIEAGTAIGESDLSLLFRYILPNILAPNLVLATLIFPGALLAASTLSFLGLGAQPPTPDWGAILNTGTQYLRSAPWISTFPGLAIMITVLGFNFLGDGLRDAFDPQLKF